MTITDSSPAGSHLNFGLDNFCFSQEEILAACTPLPKRLLLGHIHYQPERVENRFTSCVGVGLILAFLGLGPAVIAAMAVREITDSRPTGLIFIFVVELALMAYGIWKEWPIPCSKKPPWRYTKWIDFQTRTLHTRLQDQNSTQPPRTWNRPLDQLTLVCFRQSGEKGITHQVNLVSTCELDSLKGCADVNEHSIQDLCSTEQPKDALEFAKALGQLWGIPFWVLEY